MKKIYTITVVSLFVFFGGLYNFRLWYRLEDYFSKFHNESVLHFAVIYSCLPYALLMLSACFFCKESKFSLWIFVTSMVFPFASIVFLSLSMPYLSESALLPNLPSRPFSVLIIGGSPFISILSLIFLFPLFLKQKHKKRVSTQPNPS